MNRCEDCSTLADMREQLQISRDLSALIRESETILKARIEELEAQLAYAGERVLNNALGHDLQVKKLREALEGMVHWFGRYPEFIPHPACSEKYRQDIESAKRVLSGQGPISKGPTDQYDRLRLAVEVLLEGIYMHDSDCSDPETCVDPDDVRAVQDLLDANHPLSGAHTDAPPDADWEG